MPATKITLRSLASHTKGNTQGKPVYLWDTDLKGFGAYISPKGEVSWIVQKWLGGRGGKAIRHVIGKYPVMSIDGARTHAAADLGDLSKGVDVVARKREARSKIRERITAPTLSEAFDLYVERRSTGNRYWAELAARVRNATAKANIGSVRLSELTKAHVRRLVEDKAKSTPVEARNLFAALRPFFAWCVEQDLITASPMASLTAPKPAEARDRVLTRREIQLLWKATETIGYPFGHFYRLLLLTGQRREEVSGMRLEELDLERRLWVIPAKRTKNGKAHTVHLSNLALDVLSEAVEARAGDDNRSFVFSTDKGQTSISGYSKAKAQLDRAMTELLNGTDDEEQWTKELEPWRVHDLRRTIASRLAEIGTPTDVADRILNHVSGSSRSGVKGVYQRYEFLPEREMALENWGSFVEKLYEPSVSKSDVTVECAAPQVGS